jgi:hypothetical protein
MHTLRNTNKKKTSVTTITFLLLATLLIVTAVSTPLAAPMHLVQSARAFMTTGTDFVVEPKAPVVVSGDNIYIDW